MEDRELDTHKSVEHKTTNDKNSSLPFSDINTDEVFCCGGGGHCFGCPLKSLTKTRDISVS